MDTRAFRNENGQLSQAVAAAQRAFAARNENVKQAEESAKAQRGTAETMRNNQRQWADAELKTIVGLGEEGGRLVAPLGLPSPALDSGAMTAAPSAGLKEARVTAEKSVIGIRGALPALDKLRARQKQLMRHALGVFALVLVALAVGGFFVIQAQRNWEAGILQHPFDVTRSVAFSPDGQTLATGARRTTRLWRISDGEHLATLEEGATYLAFSPDGNTLATSYGQYVRVWRVSDGTLLYTITNSNGTVSDVAFSPDGQRLAFQTATGTLRVLKANEGTPLDTLEMPEETGEVAFSPDWYTLASMSNQWDGTVRLVRMIDGKVMATLKGPQDTNPSVAFSPDGQMLAAVYQGGTNNAAWLWRVNDGTFVDGVGEQPFYAYTVAFSPDGQALATGSSDRTIRLWRVADGELLKTLNGHDSGVLFIAFSPDGQTLASVSLDDTVRLWRDIYTP